MKKILFLLSLLVILISCYSIKYGELYSITDEFVDELQTTYESYGLIGGMDHIKYTNDKDFKVTPIGRLVIVRIEHNADDKEYNELQKALESHYSSDSRVNRVYRNQGGTIVIDCRN